MQGKSKPQFHSPDWHHSVGREKVQNFHISAKINGTKEKQPYTRVVAREVKINTKLKVLRRKDCLSILELLIVWKLLEASIFSLGIRETARNKELLNYEIISQGYI